MKQFSKLNIIFCGVGGQGIISLAKMAQKLLLQDEYTIKCFDVMGLGQRGGSVSSHLRVSKDKIMSPLIPVGEVDYLVGLEQTETLRNLHYLSPNGYVIACDYKLTSPSVNAGLEKDLHLQFMDILKEKNIKELIFPMSYFKAEKINYVNLNFSLLSILLSILEYNLEDARSVLKSMLPVNRVQENLFAFEKGITYLNNKNLL
ncbi:TPA: hypothetical protein MD077_005072 [Klebsiella pneumoniae]|nr:hypothetical protein [Klebsiella pneumoniae]